MRMLPLAAVSLAAAVSLYGVLELASMLNKAGSDPYRIQQQLARYGPVSELLPINARIGYLSDLDANTTRGQVFFFAAQYAIAPRLLVGNPGQDVVLGNFANAGAGRELAAKHQLEVAADFGAGLVLLRRKGARK